MLDLGLVALLVCAGVVVLGSVVQGTVGFGLALVASPVLVLVEPALVPAAMLVVSGLLPWTTLAQEWRHIDWFGLRWSLAGRMVGTAVGVWVVAHLGVQGVAVTVALMVLFSVLVTVSGISLPVNRPNLAVAGALGGVGGTAAAIGGPPLAVLYSRETGPRIRATLAAFFAVGHVVSLGALLAAGAVDSGALLVGLVLLPATLVGAWLARRWRHHLDAGRTRPAVLAVASVSAVVLLVRALF